ncbi:MAG: hypothetical protein RR245_00530 [Clostridia bacterium]
MKGKLTVRKALAVFVVVLLLVTLFAACDPTGKDNDKFVPPDGGNINDGGTITDGNKTFLSSSQAMDMLIASMNKSRELNQFDATVLNFQFEIALDLNESKVRAYYAIQVKGSIDLVDDKRSQLQIEVVDQRTGMPDKLVVGFYSTDGAVYIDLRGSAKGSGVHVFKVDNLDLAWLASTMQEAFKRLELDGFMEGFELGSVVDVGGIPVVGDLIGGNIPSIITNLIQKKGSYMVDNGDGSSTLIMPTILNDPAMASIAFGAIGGLLGADIYELVELIFGWDVETIFGGLQDGATKFGLFFRAEIKNDCFKKMSIGINVQDENPLDIDVGVKDIIIGKKPIFEMPDFTNVVTESYSFTTLNLDLELIVNATQHSYTIAGIDTAFGQLISGLLAGEGNSLSFVDASGNPIGLGKTEVNFIEDTTFKLRVKLRAEIDLRDNNKTKILLEIIGGENNAVRAGIYYIGSEEAAYIDLSGMGSGRFKIDSYPREISSVDPNGAYVKKPSYVADDKGKFIKNEAGEYVKFKDEPAAGVQKYKEEFHYTFYDAATDKGFTRYSVRWEDTPLNLTSIIKDSLAKVIPTIPSLMSLITGSTGGDAASSEEDENRDVIKGLFDSGEVLIEHYLEAGATAAEGETKVDTIGLIKKILLCADIKRGDSKMSFDYIVISLTEDVLGSIFSAIKPGLELPITKAEIIIDSSSGPGLDGIYISAALGDKKAESKEERELITLDIKILTEYGSAMDDYVMPDINDPTRPFLPLHIGMDELGNVTGISDINLSVDGKFRLQAKEGKWDLSPLEEVMYGLMLQLDVIEDIDMYYGFKIAANLNLSKISGPNVLEAIEARIELTKNPGANALPAIVISLVNGKLYIDAAKIGLPLIMLDIAKITGGKIDIFKNIPGGGSAISTADPAAKPDIMGIIAAIISGVNISNNSLEVALATNLLGGIVSALKPELAGKENIIKALPTIADGSGIKIDFEGLNLSELYINLNVGLESDENRIDLGLGLGHIRIGFNKLDLAPKNTADYVDILTDLNVFLGVEGQLKIELKEGEIDLNNMIGALLVDMASGARLNPYIDVQEDILAGIDLSVQMSLDLKNDPKYNNSQIVIEARSLRTGKLLLGAYYEDAKLYVDGAGLGIEKFCMEINLIDLIYGLIVGDGELAEPGAIVAAEAKPPVDLSGLQLAVVLSKRGLQVKVLTGLTGLIVGLIADSVEGGDTADDWMLAILENEGMTGFDLPEIGAKVDIDLGTGSGKPLLNAIKIIVEVTGSKDIDSNPTLRLTIALGGIDIGVSLRDIVTESRIDKSQFTTTKGLENLYLEVVGAIELGANASDPEVMKYSLGDYMAQFAKEFGSKPTVDANGNPILDANGNPVMADKMAIYDLLCKIMLKFNVANDLYDVIGFRIAGNLAIDALMLEGSAMTPKVPILLEKSELAIELCNGAYGKSDKIIGIYLKDGWIYVELKGKILANSQLKINIAGLGAMGNLNYVLESEAKEDDLAMADGYSAGTIKTYVTKAGVYYPVTPTNEQAYAKVKKYIKVGDAYIALKDATFEQKKAAEGYVAATFDRYVKDTINTKETYVLLTAENQAKYTDLVKFPRYVKIVQKQAAKPGNGTALATADKAPVDIQSIGGILNGFLKSVSITNHSISVNLGANLLGAVMGLIIGGSGYEIPILNEENSYIKWDYANPEIYGDNVKALTIGLGINPIYLRLSLGGFKFGMAHKDVVPFTDAELKNFKSLVDLANVSLSAEIGIDLELKEGAIPLGGIISAIAPLLKKDIGFDLDIDVKDNIAYNLRIYLKANLNLQDLNKTEIFLEIMNEPLNGEHKKVLGLYLDGTTLYVDSQVLNIAKFKIEGFDLLGALLQEDINGLLQKLKDALGGSASAAAEEKGITSQETIDILFSLSEHNIKIILTESIVLGLLKALAPTMISTDIVDLIKSLNLQAKVEINTVPFKLAVRIDTDYLALGIHVAEPRLSTEPIEDMFKYALANKDQFASYSNKCIGIELDIAIKYQLYDRTGANAIDLSSILSDLSGLESLKNPDKKMVRDLLNSIMLKVQLQETKGEIGLRVAANLMLEDLYAQLAASSAKPQEGPNGNWWVGQDTGIKYDKSVKAEVVGGYWVIGGKVTTIPYISGSVAENGKNGNWWIGQDLGILYNAAVVPTVGNGNWWIGNQDTGRLYNKDEKAESGANGNWWIGGQDTGIKYDKNVKATDGNGTWWVGTRDTGVVKIAADVLKFLEASITISFEDGTKSVVLSLSNGNIYAKLDDIGGPNIKLNLMGLMGKVNKPTNSTTGSGVSLSTADEAQALAEININDILSNAISSITIAKGFGMDIAIAPQLLVSLINSLAPGILSDKSLKHLSFVDELTDDSAFKEKDTVLSSDIKDSRDYAKTNIINATTGLNVVNYVLLDELVPTSVVEVKDASGSRKFVKYSEIAASDTVVAYKKVRHSGISYKTNDLAINGGKSLNIDLAFYNGFDLGISIRDYNVGAARKDVLPLDDSAYTSLDNAENEKLTIGTTLFITFEGKGTGVGDEVETIELGSLIENILTSVYQKKLEAGTVKEGDIDLGELGRQLAAISPVLKIAKFSNKAEVRIKAALVLDELLNGKTFMEKMANSEFAVEIVSVTTNGESKVLGLYLSKGFLYVERRDATNPIIKFDLSKFFVKNVSGGGASVNALSTGDASAENDPVVLLTVAKHGLKIDLTTALIEKLLSVLIGANIDLTKEINGAIAITWAQEGTKGLNLQEIGLSVDVNISTLHLGIGVKGIDIGILPTSDSIVPKNVTLTATAIDDAILDISLKLNIGIDITNDIDLAKLLSVFGVDALKDFTKLIKVPEGGAHIGLILEVAASLNLGNLDATEAAIIIKAKIGNNANEVAIATALLKDGNIYLDVSNLFGINAKTKIAGFKFSDLLGAKSIFDLLQPAPAAGVSENSLATGAATQSGLELGFTGSAIEIKIGAQLVKVLLNMLAPNFSLPMGIDIGALLEVQYINHEVGDPNFGKLEVAIKLKAWVANLLGISLSIDDINLGFRTDNAPLVTLPADAATAYPTLMTLGMLVQKNPDGSDQLDDKGKVIKKLGIQEFNLEKISLNLELNLNSEMIGGIPTGSDSNEMDISGFFGALLGKIDSASMFLYDENGNKIGKMNRQLALKISAEIDLKQIIELTKSADPKKEVGKILKAINANIELVKTVQIDGVPQPQLGGATEDVLLGIYLKNGDIGVYLQGLGMSNVVIEHGMLLDIIAAAGAGASENALATAIDTSSINIGSMLNDIIKSITLAQKALTIVLQDNYLQAIFNTLLPDFKMGTIPDFGMGGGNKIQLNLGAFSDKTNKTGLLAIDLQFYGLNVGIDLYPPTIGFGTPIKSAPDMSTWTKFAQGATDISVALALSGNLEITGNNTGVALGKILNNVVGDLSTKLIVDGAKIDFKISASIKLEFDLLNKKIGFGEMDLSVILERDTKLLAGIYYSNTDETVYIDASHFFSGANNPLVNSTATGKIAIKGIKLSSLIFPDKKADAPAGGAVNALFAGATVDGKAAVTDKEAQTGGLISTAALWAEFGPNTMLVTVASGIINKIIALAAPDAGVDGMLPNIAIKLDTRVNPFRVNIGVEVQDDEFKNALGIKLGINGFDNDEHGGPKHSDLSITTKYNSVLPATLNRGEYKELVTLNIPALQAGNIGEGLKFKNDVVNLSLSLKLDFTANQTADGQPRDWAKYLSTLFGLSDAEFDVLVDILGFNNGQSKSAISLTIDAALNLPNIINGFNLAGSEVRVTLGMISDVLSNGLYQGGEPAKMVITLIGDEGNGESGIYLDLSGYRGKGKHKLSLDLMGLISGASAKALATANTGLLGEQIFTVLDGLLESVHLGDGKLAVNLSKNSLNTIFKLLLPEQEFPAAPLLGGGVVIDLRNLHIGVNLDFDNAMSIGIGIGYISLAKPDDYRKQADGKFSFIANKAEFKDLKQLKLNLDLLGELSYTGIRTSSTNPAIDLSELFKLIKIKGKPLLENPLFQLRVGSDMGTTYVINTHAYLDLSDFNKLKVSLEVWDTIDPNHHALMIGAYLDGQDVFLDLSSLGFPKLKIEGVNLAGIMEKAMGGFLEHDKAVGASNSALSTASIDGGLGNSILGGSVLPYVALVFRPEVFAIGLNAAFIDAIVNVVKRSQGEDIAVGEKFLPNFGDIAIIGDSRTFYKAETEVSEAEKANIRDRYVRDGYVAITAENKSLYRGQEMYAFVNGTYKLEKEATPAELLNNDNRFVDNYVLLTTANSAAYAGKVKYLKIGGKLLPELAIKVTDGFYGSIRLNDVHINGNLADPLKVNWETANSVFAERIEGNKTYQPVYNIATKQIGLDKVNLGLDISLKFLTQKSELGDADYSDSFQFYLSSMLSSLLGNGTDLTNFKLHVPDDIIGYTLAIKLSASISELISDTGFNIAGLLNSELFIEFRIEGNFTNTLVLGLYKQANDSAIYADLSGLGLPKVKLIGLGGLLAGIGSALADVIQGAAGSSALATAGSNTGAPPAFAEIAIENGRVEISLEMEVLRQIFASLGLETKKITFKETATNGGVNAEATYTAIVIRNEDGSEKMAIPLPNLEVIRISLDIAKKLNSITLEVGLDSIGNTLILSIGNLNLSTGDGFFTNEFENLKGANADKWGAIILGDSNGVSMGNIIKGALDAIDPNITVILNKRVACKNVRQAGTGQMGGIDNETYTPSYTTVKITRTNGDADREDGKNSGGDPVFGGKLAVNLHFKSKGNQASATLEPKVSVWLFNNAIYGDLGALAGILGGIDAVKKLKFADLNIVDMIAKGGAASEESVAQATAEAAAPAPDTMATIKNYIKGIQISWWNNTSVAGTLGDPRYSTIRVDLNPAGINDLLLYLYYLLFTLQYRPADFSDPVIPAEYPGMLEFKALSYETKKAIVVQDDTKTVTEGGKTYKCTDAYRACPYFLHKFAANMIGSLLGTTALDGLFLDNASGSIANILAGIISGLLPIPLLEEGRPNYVEIVLDKNNANGILREVGIYINKNATSLSGNTLTNVDVKDADDNAEIKLQLNGLFLRSVSGVQWYNDTEKAFGEKLGITSLGDTTSAVNKTYLVADAFNPVELSFNATNNPTALPQRVDATFTGITNYTSKGQNGQNKSDSWVELGGTAIIWDVSEVNLTPGSTDSFIYGYALNKQIAKIPVTVGLSTGYMKLQGYVDSTGAFVKTDKLVINPSLNPTAANATTLIQLPETIVIQQNNGQLQLLSTKFKPTVYAVDAAGKPVLNPDGTQKVQTPASPSVVINGSTIYAAGSFGWIEGDATELALGGDITTSFWYKVNKSDKIKVNTTVQYVNNNATRGYLPSVTDEDKAKFDVLNGGSALDMTATSLDIENNIRALKKISVEYSNGEVRKVDVLEWKFNLSYNKAKYFEGASGNAIAVINHYAADGTNVKQEIKVPIKVNPGVVVGLSGGSVVYDQYTEFTKENLLPEIVDVIFRVSRVRTEVGTMSRDDIALYNTTDALGNKALVLPSNITLKSDTTLKVTASVGKEGISAQVFEIEVNIKPKNITKAYIAVTKATAPTSIKTIDVTYLDGTSDTLQILDRGNLDTLNFANGGIFEVNLKVGLGKFGFEKYNQQITAEIRVLRDTTPVTPSPVAPPHAPAPSVFSNVVAVENNTEIANSEIAFENSTAMASSESATAAANVPVTDAKITNKDNESVVFDPLYEMIIKGNKLAYPATTNITLLNGTTKDVTFVSSTLVVSIVNATVEGFSTRSIKGGEFVDTVTYTDGTTTYVINIPVSIIDRQIKSDTLKATLPDFDPFLYDPNPLSGSFSFPKESVVTFENGSTEKVNIKWADVNVTYTAADGLKSFIAVASYGSTAGASRNVTCAIKKFRVTKLEEQIKQWFLDNGHNFEVYPVDKANDAKLLSNYPSTLTIVEKNMTYTINLKWNLETLKYTFASDSTPVNVEIGNDTLGYQKLAFTLPIAACIIDYVVCPALVDFCTAQLDPFTYNSASFDVVRNLVASDIMVYFKNNARPPLAMKPIWNLDKIRATIGGEPQCITATFFTNEFAGEQIIRETRRDTVAAAVVNEIKFIGRKAVTVFDTVTGKLLINTDPVNVYSKLTAMPNSVSVVYEILGKAGQFETIVYTTDGSGLNGNVLYSQAGFRPNVNGDKCTVDCRLTVNGVLYVHTITYEADILKADAIKQWGKDSAAVDWKIVDGVITNVWEINPLTASRSEQSPGKTNINVSFAKFGYGETIVGTWIKGIKKFVIKADNTFDYFENETLKLSGSYDPNSFAYTINGGGTGTFGFVKHDDVYAFNSDGTFTRTLYNNTTRGTYTATGSIYTLTYKNNPTQERVDLTGVPSTVTGAVTTFTKFKSIENTMRVVGNLGSGDTFGKSPEILASGATKEIDFGIVDLRMPAGYKATIGGGDYKATVGLGKGEELILNVKVLNKSFTIKEPSNLDTTDSLLPNGVDATFTDTTLPNQQLSVYWDIKYYSLKQTAYDKDNSRLQVVFDKTGTILTDAQGTPVVRKMAYYEELQTEESTIVHAKKDLNKTFDVNAGKTAAGKYIAIGYVGRVIDSDGYSVLLDTEVTIKRTITIKNYSSAVPTDKICNVWISTDDTYTGLVFDKTVAHTMRIVSGKSDGANAIDGTNTVVEGTYTYSMVDGKSQVTGFTVGGTTYTVKYKIVSGEEIVEVNMAVTPEGVVSQSAAGAVLTFKVHSMV